MGWMKHVEWDLINDFEVVVDHGLLYNLECPDGGVEAMTERYTKIVEDIAYGRKVSEGDQRIFDTIITPLLDRVDDLRVDDAFYDAMDKDD